MREEKDLLGTLMVPDEAYYGIQTQRAVLNFSVSGKTAGEIPHFYGLSPQSSKRQQRLTDKLVRWMKRKRQPSLLR